MNKVGIVLNHLGSSQLAFSVITYANVLAEQTKVQPTVFYENIMPPCVQPRFQTTCISDAYSYDGIMITTTVEQARSVARYPGNTFRAMYVWDLEWLRRPGNYLYYLEAYRSQNILFTRSEDYVKAIENISNKRVYMVEDFNLLRILEIIWNLTTSPTKS